MYRPVRCGQCYRRFYRSRFEPVLKGRARERQGSGDAAA